MGWIITAIVCMILTFIGIIIGRLVYAYNNMYSASEDTKKKYKKRTTGYCFLSLCWLVLLIFPCFTIVEANHVGVVYSTVNGIQDEVKTEGFKVKSPLDKIIHIETQNKQTQITVSGQTSDSAYADFVISIIYKVEAENASKFYKATNSTNISDSQFASLAKEALQSSTIKYDIYAILGNSLEEVRIDFTNNLTTIALERYAITIVSTSFDDIDAGTRIEEIIKNKAEALQQIEIAQAQQEEAKVNAETEKINAEAKAEVAKIQAEAEAEVKKIAADAEAYKVNAEKSAVTDMIDALYEKYQASLSYKECADIVLQTLFYETWNGEFPEVVTSDSLSTLIGSLISGTESKK